MHFTLSTNVALLALASIAQGIPNARRRGLSHVKRSSNSFAGSNIYFLYSLSESDPASYINRLGDAGAKVIRSGLTALARDALREVMSPILSLNLRSLLLNTITTLAKLEAVLAQTPAKGIKAIISPHDGNVIHDSSAQGKDCDVYCSTYGTSFYSNLTAQEQLDARIAAILIYTSPSSGKKWSQWSDAILTFDLENEPFQFTDDGAINDPARWLCGRAQNFKNNLGIYFNRSDVQKALHVPPTNYSLCDETVIFSNGDGSVPSALGPLPKVIEATNNVIIGHGWFDFLFFLNGTLATIQNMTWNGAQGFQHPPTEPLIVPYTHGQVDPNTWDGGSGVLGTAHTERGLTFSSVYRSGHEIPQYAPGAAYRQLELLLGRIKSLQDTGPFTTQQ